ncbi:Protein PAM1, partial [Bienertia sinuspersici]
SSKSGEAQRSKSREIQNTCGFFKWTHEVQNVDDLQYMVLEKDTALIELEHEKKTLKKEVEELKAENAKLEDMVAELSIENTETRLFMEATMADKKLVVALISWVFFCLCFLHDLGLCGIMQ